MHFAFLPIVADQFLSTPSGWRATDFFMSKNVKKRFLSTPSGWRATAQEQAQFDKIQEISIHALRVEGDTARDHSANISLISIHALRVEGDRKPIHYRLFI